MISSRSLLLLAALLGAAAAASSHAPNRWGLMQTQRPTTPAPTTPPPMAAPAQNTTGEMQQMMTQMMGILLPKIQAKVTVLLGNVGRAIAGAMFATFRTGFKVRLTATFAPLDADSKFPSADLEGHPPGYIMPGFAEEEVLRFQEPSADDAQITERQLS